MKQYNNLTILSIETSCDDTGIAVLAVKKEKLKILSNVVSSQVKIHKKWGGVFPSLAKREHQKNLVPVLEKVLKESKLLKKVQSLKLKVKNFNSKLKKLKEILEREEYLFKKFLIFSKKYQKPKIDLIAVTVGPGLEPCLWVGVNFAKALAYFWELPIIPVNHIEAHILANWLSPVGKNFQFSIFNFQNILPAVCLIVSGGHTQLILMKDFGKYKILGETRDDAAGECFDKVARILGLGYPGGPIIALQAEKSSISNLKSSIKLPRPMINQKNYDFSFSGLKTAVLYQYQNQSSKIKKSKKYIQEVCAEVQQAVIDVLIAKTLKAAKEFKVKSIILGGGVAANKELRKQFREKIKKELPKVQFFAPFPQFSTDNAAMVGITAYYHYLKGGTKNWSEIKARANWRLK